MRSFRILGFALIGLLAFSSLAHGQITFLGVDSFPGDATDRSGLTGAAADGTPLNRLGGLGSAIAYTGRDNRYIMLSDRGPHDGAVDFPCRFHEVEIVVTPSDHSSVVTLKLHATVLLKDPHGRLFTGAQAAIHGPAHRLDPEGVRVGPSGTLFISDEYGPRLDEFDPANGQILRSLVIPEPFRVKKPGRANDEELPPHNSRGRQPNRGMEGLAISPDGRKLFGLMQSPLIQDGAFDHERKQIGHNNRLLEIDASTGKTREFVYPLSHAHTSVSEMLAINEHEFLVLERDGLSGTAAKFKRIFAIDIAGATDVSSVEHLPSKELPRDIRPVAKRPFLDLLDSKFRLAGERLPQKFEGLAFGPDLPDGRVLLLVTVDNDYVATAPTSVYAFAVDRSNLPRFERQRFTGEHKVLK